MIYSDPQNNILIYRLSLIKCADIYFCISSLSSLPWHTRCSWQETKVWNPGATPKPSWSMNGGSSWVWICTLIPASNDVSSVDKKRLGHLQQGRWFVCTRWPAWSTQQPFSLMGWRKRLLQQRNTFQAVSTETNQTQNPRNNEASAGEMTKHHWLAVLHELERSSPGE